MNPSDIANLIKKMDRPSDKGLFAVDVVTAYPELKDQYIALCPERLNLKEMQEKALQGHYSGVEWHVKVAADIELIANNCIKFNGGPQTEFGLLADAFQKYALALINEAMLKPSRPGRQSGGKRKAQEIPPSSATGAAAAISAAPAAPTQTAAGGGGGAGVLASSPSRLTLNKFAVKEVKVVKASEHHLPFKIPMGIKKWSVHEYTCNHSLVANNGCGGDDTTSGGQQVGGGCKLPAPNGISVSAVVSKFIETMSKINPAAAAEPGVLYPLSTASAVVEALCGVFQVAFTKCLLFVPERQDVNVFLLKHCGADAGAEMRGTERGQVVWANYAEPKFLVRLLLHFPHIGSLVAHNTTPAGGEILAQRVIPVIEDLLVFMDANAEQLGLVAPE